VAQRLTHDLPMPRKPINVRDVLSTLLLFRELSADEIARMAAGSVEMDAPRGSVPVHRGDPCRRVHIVIFGKVKLALQAAGDGEKFVELIGPGMSVVEPVRRTRRQTV
jgi:CRP-like cAMP-binding protein